MTSDHKRHLLLLTEQSPQVLQDFCKLAVDYLQKGPNLKIYGAAANKLSVEPELIRTCVESLINLLLESDKRQLSIGDFQESVESLGFANEKAPLLCKLYESERAKISHALENIGFKLPEYRNIEWRFQVEIASRSLFSQLTPVFAIHLTLKNENNSDKYEHHLMQIDPTNLVHLVQQLEFALQEARSQHMRKIRRSIKLF